MKYQKISETQGNEERSDGRLPSPGDYAKCAHEYSAGRPGYPSAVLSYLRERCNVNPSSHVVDLGAGSGKMTSLLAQSGARVSAVEPVEAMRKELRRNCPDVALLAGTAEALPLGGQSADVIVAAQAFHWFHFDRTLPEIHRVLKPWGFLMLIWNVRDKSSLFMRAYDEVVSKLKDRSPSYQSGEWRTALDGTPFFRQLDHVWFTHAEQLDRDGLRARLLSNAYVTSLSMKEQECVWERMLAVFLSGSATSGAGEIEMQYVTHVYAFQRSG